MAVRCYKATVTLVDHLWYCATFQVNLLLAPLWRTMGLDAVRAHDSWPADIDSIRCLQFRQFSSVYSCLRVLSIWYAYIRSASCAARWCPLIFASWCGAVHVHILKKKKGLYWLRKILHNTENTTLLYYRRGRWGLLLWAIQCQKMMWLRTERSNRFSTVQYGSDVLSYPFGKLLHQVMHLWSSKCCRVWASWNGFQFFSHALSPTHDHHVKQPSEGWYGWLMTFYSIVCSSRREDGILCLQLFLDYLQACQWQLLTINLILVDHASQTRLAFCTSCRKHVCFALYSRLN